MLNVCVFCLCVFFCFCFFFLFCFFTNLYSQLGNFRRLCACVWCMCVCVCVCACFNDCVKQNLYMYPLVPQNTFTCIHVLQWRSLSSKLKGPNDYFEVSVFRDNWSNNKFDEKTNCCALVLMKVIECVWKQSYLNSNESKSHKPALIGSVPVLFNDEWSLTS